MQKKSEFAQMVVQRLPGAGLLVRLKASRVINDDLVSEIREEFLSLVAPERLLLLDLTNVTSIGSAFLSVLMATQRRLRKAMGSMSICGMRPDFEDIFRITRLDKRFDIYPDLESALKGSDTGLV